MLKILLIIILIPLLIAIVFGVSVLRFLFVPRRKQNQANKNNQFNNSQSKQKQTQREPASTSKKIIDSDEGEYIDYEEVED